MRLRSSVVTCLFVLSALPAAAQQVTPEPDPGPDALPVEQAAASTPFRSRSFAAASTSWPPSWSNFEAANPLRWNSRPSGVRASAWPLPPPLPIAERRRACPSPATVRCSSRISTPWTNQAQDVRRPPASTSFARSSTRATGSTTSFCSTRRSRLNTPTRSRSNSLMSTTLRARTSRYAAE